MRRTLALYDDSPRADRLFVRVRAFLSDLAGLERHAPRAGRSSISAAVTACSPTCWRSASDARRHRDRPRRRQGRVRPAHRPRPDEHPLPGGDATTYRRTLRGDHRRRCLLPDPARRQRALLAACARCSPGGLLIWKSQVRHPRWKYAITRGQEWLMTTSARHRATASTSSTPTNRSPPCARPASTRSPSPPAPGGPIPTSCSSPTNPAHGKSVAFLPGNRSTSGRGGFQTLAGGQLASGECRRVGAPGPRWRSRMWLPSPAGRVSNPPLLTPPRNLPQISHLAIDGHSTR